MSEKMTLLCFTTCGSSKSGLGDKMLPPSNLVDYPSCMFFVWWDELITLFVNPKYGETIMGHISENTEVVETSNTEKEDKMKGTKWKQ